MCIATIATVASTVVSAAGSVAGGIAKSNAESYQAQVARNNAIIARQNAQHAASAGASQTEQAGMKAAQRQAAVRAAMAANGVDVNSGSAVDVQVGQREVGNLDAATVAGNAALEAYGYESQGVGFTAQAGLDQRAAQADLAGGIIGGVGKLIGNPTIDSGVAGAFGGGSVSLPGNPDVMLPQLDNSLPSTSLLSGYDALPDDFAWMRDSASFAAAGA